MKTITLLMWLSISWSLAMAETRPADPLPSSAQADSTHVIDRHNTILEAETGTGGWARLEEAGETVIQSVPNERMVYMVRFNEPGFYYVHLRCRLTSGMVGPDGTILADHSTNDAHVTVGGELLYGSDHVTRPEGIRCHSNVLRWWSLPKGPGGHTPDNIRNAPVTTYIPEAGVYEVALRYRSPGFVVDKIAFTRGPASPTETSKAQ